MHEDEFADLRTYEVHFQVKDLVSIELTAPSMEDAIEEVRRTWWQEPRHEGCSHTLALVEPDLDHPWWVRQVWNSLGVGVAPDEEPRRIDMREDYLVVENDDEERGDSAPWFLIRRRDEVES